MLGLKGFGVESRSSWGRMLVSDAFSVAIMASVVNTIKYTAHVRRPDKSNYKSFPSGHTATAFMAAMMMHKEYGDRSPWYSISAFTVATATGISRILNNRHWLSDVLAGSRYRYSFDRIRLLFGRFDFLRIKVLISNLPGIILCWKIPRLWGFIWALYPGWEV